ncbi:AAEL006614-PA [Aedes aegypti]|uniref:AAEL006614-PA n=1 Tax=Aedes aegypti TaxID=7159 RepID=Q175K8_AEDAE|nr:AAEL006614-PA [Aedes aegypti]
MSSIALPNVESDSFNHANEGSSKRTIPGECDRQLQNERENSENLGRDPVPIEANENSDAKCGSAEQTNIGDGTTTKNASSGRKRGRPPKKPDKPPPQEQKKKGRPKNEANCNLSCDICGKESNTLRDLELHQKIHFGIKDFECEYCHVRFAQKGTLKVHLRTHTGEKPFKCSYCPEAFAQKVSLDNHVFKHTGKGVKCPLCPSIHATPSSVKQHMKQVHSEERPNVCQICGRSYKKKRDLMKHIEGHDNLTNLECKFCHKQFTGKRVLRDHLRTHTGDKPYKCQHCSKSFRFNCLLNKHLLKHTKQGIKCDLCPRVFATKTILKQHKENVHAMEKNYKCQLCDKRFKFSRSLRIHLHRHEDKTCKRCGEVCNGLAALMEHRKTAHPPVKEKPGPLICELCGKTSASASSLAAHRAQHKEYLRFKCDECPKAFVFKGMLETHKRVEHHGERHICPNCGKQFKHLAYLKRHSYQHKEDKGFKCEKCPSAFRHPGALRYHVRAKHGETMFPCSLCSKEYRTAEALKVHQKIHSDERRFHCEFCPREFIQRATLLKHMTIHSADRQQKCVVCEQIFYKKVELAIHQAKEHPNHPLIGRTVKLHTCGICGMNFTKENLLRQHTDIHGSEYKFKCDMCEDKKFKQMAGLRYHWHHFHGIEPPKRNLGKKTEKKAEKVDQSESRSAPFENDLEFMIYSTACGSTSSNTR